MDEKRYEHNGIAYYMSDYDLRNCIVIFALDSTDYIKQEIGLDKFNNLEDIRKIARRIFIYDDDNIFLSEVEKILGKESQNKIKEWFSDVFFFKKEILENISDIVYLLIKKWDCVDLKNTDAPLKSIKFLKERLMIRECYHQTSNFMYCCTMLEDITDSDTEIRSEVELLSYNLMVPIVQRYYPRGLFTIPLYYDLMNEKLKYTRLFKHLIEILPRSEKVKILELHFKDKISNVKKKDNSARMEIIDFCGLR